MFEKLWNYYFKHYKKIMLIPLIIILTNILLLISVKYSTGSFFAKDMSLKGGYTVSVEASQVIDVNELTARVKASLNLEQVEIKLLTDPITHDIYGYDLSSPETINSTIILQFFKSEYNLEIPITKVSEGFQSPVLAESFYSQAVIALILAFLLMGCVVFYYFRNIAPSLSIITSTVADIICILGFSNIIGLKLGTASIGAILMIIGYSTDSDILLSTNVIKRKDGALKDRMLKALKTELTMGIAAVSVFGLMFFLSSASLIKEMAVILLMGLIFDFVNTWGLTAGLQRIILEKRRND